MRPYLQAEVDYLVIGIFYRTQSCIIAVEQGLHLAQLLIRIKADNA